MTFNNLATCFIQSNLKKKQTATANILKDLTVSTVLLLTEPQVSKHKRIPGIPKSHRAFLSAVGGRPRAALVLPVGLANISIKLGQYSSPDMTTVRIDIGNRPFILCSAYFDINLVVPDPMFTALCERCSKTKTPLIAGIDTNSRHTLWKDRLCNARGHKLTEALSAHSLHIENVGSDPTFRSASGGSSIIDLTLSNDYANSLVTRWTSSFDNCNSDHARITFYLALDKTPSKGYRNPNKCDWTLYRDLVSDALTDRPFRYRPNPTPAHL